MSDVLFKPLLAVDAVLDKLRYPLLASPKLDGVRAVVRDGVVYSRSNKPIPNAYVQHTLHGYEHFDGELIVGEPTSKSCYRDTISHVMAHDKRDFDLRFYVFDHVQHPTERYWSRMPRADKRNLIPPVFALEQRLITDEDMLLACEEQHLEAGYEGLILRDPDAPYKCGRSTVKEGYLLKLKRFVDHEFPIIGFEERMHNGNEATTNELGRTKRSSHATGKSGRGDLGAVVLGLPDGSSFSCGTGFDDGLRAHIWANQDKYLGQLAKIKHFEIGAKDRPRHPVWLGLRYPVDL